MFRVILTIILAVMILPIMLPIRIVSAALDLLTKLSLPSLLAVRKWPRILAAWIEITGIYLRSDLEVTVSLVVYFLTRKLPVLILTITATLLAATVATAGTGLRTRTGSPTRMRYDTVNVRSGGNYISDKPDWYGPMMQDYLYRSYGLRTFSLPGYSGYGYTAGSGSGGYGGGTDWSGYSPSGPQTYYNPFVPGNEDKFPKMEIRK